MSTRRKKFEIDAAGQSVGRIATRIAMALMGKNSPHYVAHLDHGDKVIVLNVKDVKFTGQKLEQKTYKHHSMHPGGLKIKPAKDVMKVNPEKALIHAVSRMLPKNKMRTQRLLRISFK